MKTKLLIILLIFIVALPVMAAPPYKSRTERPMSAVVDNATYINANRILMFVTNHGNFGRDLSGVFGYDAGTFYPYFDNASIEDGSEAKYALYASGLWIGGVVNGETRVIIAEYSDEYIPGPMDEFVSVTGTDTTWTFNADFDTDPAFRVYKLYSDSMGGMWGDNPNTDWTEWPVGDGAPVDENNDPAMIGDQMLWAVFNDANPEGHANDAGETEPLGLEVRQTTWAFNRQDALGEVIFVRTQVFNRGGNTITECYFSLWADPDLGEYTDDLVGCDTTLSLGYVYNSDNDDAGFYEKTPPCLGYDFFQGPLLFTGDDNDVARMWGTTFPGYVNMGMTSFNKYINGTDPNNFSETYNYMRGFNPDGSDYINNEGVATLFQLAGDPVKGTGDIDFDPADRRFMMSTGPVTFAPGDSTEFVYAIIVAQSTNRLTSISLMKNQDKFAQIAYDANFVLPEPPATPIVNVAWMDQGISLSWTDTSEIDHGTYPFEGYMVWQGESANGPWTQVAAFDLQNFLEDVFDEVFDPVTGVAELRLVKNGEELGVSRHIFLDEDHILGGPLRNISEYFYKVEAYTVDLSQPLGFRTLTSAVIKSATPQRPVAGTEYEANFGDTLAWEHPGGISNGALIPIVVDQTQLTGHTYRVTFTETDGTLYWHLMDVDLGTMLLEDQTNETGDDTYTIVDGMMVKVLGAQFGVVAIQEVADASGPIDPDNVMWSLNSTGDWYVGSDQSSNFARMNWRGLIGTYDWEFRFTAGGSQAYEFGGDTLATENVPFEVWNIGIGTPDDASDDVRITPAYIDDDANGGWSYGDRNYPSEDEYVEPLPDEPVYSLWRIGRIKFNDASEATTAPAEGTIVRFTTAKVNTVDDVFEFDTELPSESMAENVLDNITVAPNPFYLFGPYDPAVGNYQIKFQNLPTECTITIYNLAGEFVNEVEKNDATTSIATWRANTTNGLPVASGIYLWVVDAPGIGQKIGKIAVFTEVEILKTY